MSGQPFFINFNFRLTYETNKQTNKLFLIVIAFTSLLLTISCSKEEGTIIYATENMENFISAKEAYSLLEDISINSSNANSLKGSFVDKEIKTITPIKDKESSCLYYIVNYKNGGFLILSADKRTAPVIAFSNTYEFLLDTNNYPSGLKDFTNCVKKEIKHIRKSNKQQDAITKKQWNKKSIQNLINSISADGRLAPDPDNDPMEPDDPNCVETYKKVGPLISTIWGQSGEYNDILTPSNCSNTSDGRPPVGCVAVAMAQIMRYHEHPDFYDWGNMLNNRGLGQVPNLMAEIGYFVDMKYGCDGSSASTKKDVAPAFTNSYFNYSSATYDDYNYSKVKQQLNWRQPVILRGGESYYGIYRNGHAWVCDGYISSFNCYNMTTSVLLHMNWGWNGRYNGWYSTGNWNPNGNTFNYQKGMVYNIRP